jgi:hypothetical protein
LKLLFLSAYPSPNLTEFYLDGESKAKIVSYFKSVSSLGVLLFPELGELLSIVRGHGGLTGSPGGGANFAMFVSILESLNKTEGLVHRATNGEIVHRDVAEDTLVVNDVGGAESNTSVFSFLNEATVVAGDRFSNIGKEGHLHGSNSTLVAGLLGVLHVGKVAVDGGSNKLGTDLFKLGGLVGELADLSRAHEGEVEGPEE